MNLAFWAFKNLWRHPWRTGIRVLGLAITTAVMMVWGSLTSGFRHLLHDSATGLELGDFQIHQPGYRDSQDIYSIIHDADAIAEKLSTVGFRVSPRVYGFALGASGDTSAGVKVIGIDPLREANVTRLHKHVRQGRWLDAANPRGVVLGSLLAKQLGVKPGSELILIGYATDGSLANEIFEVQGILAAVTADLDNRGVYLGEQGFREFFLTSQGAHELALAQSNPSEPLDIARTRINRFVQSMEVLSWRELKPFLARTIDLQAITAYFTLMFSYIALGGLVLNLTFMRVYDRIREYGVMQAIGMLPSEIATLNVRETIWLAVVSALLALAIGVPISLWLEVIGIDFSWIIDRLAFAGLNIEPVLYPVVGTKQILAPIAFLVLTMPCFALYPAIEAARMPPLKAMHRL